MFNWGCEQLTEKAEKQTTLQRPLRLSEVDKAHNKAIK